MATILFLDPEMLAILVFTSLAIEMLAYCFPMSYLPAQMESIIRHFPRSRLLGNGGGSLRRQTTSRLLCLGTECN
ncbi:hypothetical protein GGR51DRAFT_525136 [Nemania sp. FL0031]|nr:hypothetical protein GGR51DRAFT_525136 [Nemania sp. FL0031]